MTAPRDPRLQGLSSEHHAALVLARRVRLAVASGDALDGVRREVADRFDRELAPHFAVEEEVLLPALQGAGRTDLVARLRQDHDRLRALSRATAEDAAQALGAFAELLAAHVRFEERVLFPACQELLPSAVLDEVARRAPKHG